MQAWQETRHIDQGDLLLTAEGATVEAGVLLWGTAHYAPAYDLTVDGIHTYHVTAGNETVLVHNQGDTWDFPMRLAKRLSNSTVTLPISVT